MPTEQILSEEQIAEIEALKPFQYKTMVALTVAQRDALCQTVRALQAENKRLRKVVDVPPNERSVCDCHTWPTVSEMHDYTVALEARLSEVEKERDELREIAEGALRFRVEVNGSCDHDEYMAKLCTQCEIRLTLKNLGIETTENS